MAPRSLGKEMKIGDLVIRAYAWRAYIPGIIVDEEIEKVQFDEVYDGYYSTNFIVHWSDGTQSREMDCELEYLERVLSVLSKDEAQGLDDYRP